jgi:hypothetical protein
MRPHTIAALALIGRYLMGVAACCFIVVVLTHLCKAYALFPWMGWGLKRSAGHYLDLCAAILGLSLFLAGFCFERWQRNVQEARQLFLGADAGATADGAGDGSGSEAGLRFLSLGSLLGKQPTCRLIRF